jgi:Mg2+-importing ATPase
MGTSVVSGTAKAVVISTGHHTYFGSMAKTIVSHRPLTNFDIGINKISWLLIQIMLFMVPIIFVINGISKDDWFQAILFALSVAVSLTPEMLPMLITTNLAKGALRMAREKVIIKQLNSIQNFGAIDLLCTDKTGTLTEDKIILEKHIDLNGTESEEVLHYGYLNSYFQTGLKNLMDVAILDHKELTTLLENYKKIDEVPFDFSRKRMSVVVSSNNSGPHLFICKGSFSTIATICTQAKINDTIIPFTDEIMKKVSLMHDQLNHDGFRVLAIAYKELPIQLKPDYHIKDECYMTLIGFLAFLDPPKQTAAIAIKQLQRVGIDIKILTGDNEIITKKICQSVQLEILGTLTGSQIDAMSSDTLAQAVEKNTIFAKLTPLHKALIINNLKKNGHVVGYLGDGINDALALREADLGISVDMAVDIAKESSDIIMLEKSLLFLSKGVIEGRKTFGNIIKYIKMAISSNFGNSFSILGASLLLPFLPMLPIQLLLQNLLYDISQLAIPFDKVDEEFLVKPQKWTSNGIARFMFFIGPISSLFDFVTFGILWFIFKANTPTHQAFFQSGWFIEGLLSQVLIVHMIRTQKIPFLQSIASFPLIVTTAVIMAIGIILPYSSIGNSVGMVALPGSYFFWLVLILLAYCTLTQLIKIWYIKKFHAWL